MNNPAATPLSQSMLEDLRRQAQCLQAIAARRPAFVALGAAILGQQRDRIVGFGSGDGWFAARAVAEHARRDLGLPFEAASSLETLAYLAPQLAQQDIAGIAISMSGSADRTNEAADALKAIGAPLLALTNGSGGALAGITGNKVSLDIVDLAPFLTGTTKYTATVLALVLLLEGAAQQAHSALTGALETLPEMLTQVETFARDFVERLGATRPTGIRILSAGQNLATAEYGMAKLIKLLPVPVWADEVEEFAHRQFWTCPATDLVIYVATNPAVARCATTSIAALSSMGMTTLVIDTPATPVSGATARFTLPAIEERLSPLFAAIPLQYLGYFLALAFGADPNLSQDVSDPARFRAAQLLARRGEIDAPAL